MSAGSFDQADKSPCSETTLVTRIYQLESTAKRSNRHSSLAGPTMSPIIMFLAIMLPLLTAVTQALNKTDLHSLFPSNPVNDNLNVTRCYCHGDLEADKPGFGYYVRETLPRVTLK